MIENLVNNLSLYLQGSVFLAFLTAYLGGLVISFTPCTYPLIPVTIGFIGAQGSSSRLRGFFLSLFYVGGIAFTYSILGGAAALSGRLKMSFPLSWRLERDCGWDIFSLQ